MLHYIIQHNRGYESKKKVGSQNQEWKGGTKKTKERKQIAPLKFWKWQPLQHTSGDPWNQHSSQKKRFSFSSQVQESDACILFQAISSFKHLLVGLFMNWILRYKRFFTLRIKYCELSFFFRLNISNLLKIIINQSLIYWQKYLYIKYYRFEI